MAKEMQVPSSVALPGGKEAMLGQWKGNLSSVQGINILETACVKDKMDLFFLGPYPAKPICYEQNQWRRMWDRNQAPVETLTQPHADSCVDGWPHLQNL